MLALSWLLFGASFLVPFEASLICDKKILEQPNRVVDLSALDNAHHSLNDKTILGVILASNLSHAFEFGSLNQYLNMCEQGWTVFVELLTRATPLNETLIRTKLRESYFCSRIRNPISVKIRKYDQKIGACLAGRSRQVFAEHFGRFAVYVYQEDDMLVTLGHVEAYLTESAKLREVSPHPVLPYMVGYLRYSGPISAFPAEGAPRDVDAIEDADRGVVGCLRGSPYLAIKRNPHQAMLILTAEELKSLSVKCNFLNQSLSSVSRMPREYMSSFSLFEGSSHFMRLMKFPPSCKVTKLIPIESIDRFLVRHRKRSSLSLPYENSMPVAEVSAALRAVSLKRDGENNKCILLSALNNISTFIPLSSISFIRD